MVEAAGEPGREPSAGLVLRLVKLHRQIDIADLERAARIGAEDPDLPHPRQVATLAVLHAIDDAVDPPRRLRALHVGQTNAPPKHRESVPLTRESSFSTTLVDAGSEADGAPPPTSSRGACN